MLHYCSDSLDYFNNNHIINELNSILENGTECDEQLNKFNDSNILNLNNYLITSVEY